MQENMNMIGHYNIAEDADLFLMQTIEPFIYCIVCLRDAKKLFPFITGESNKINTVRKLIVLKADRH
jgi:hypothetical protein